jgi:anhydro-N-acetylmuramic acid kinase
MKASPGSSSRGMTVAGIMSGTSADGIDVALVKIRATRDSIYGLPQLGLLAHVAVPYPTAVRKGILQMMNADAASVAEMSRLHWRLGQLYADAV